MAHVIDHAETIPALTERELGYRAFQVDRFIRQFFAEHGRTPTYDEIMEGVGIGSKGEVSRIAGSLERRGRVVRVGAAGGLLRLMIGWV